MLITTVKLPGALDYESHMVIHTSTTNKCISLAKEFQKHLSDPTKAHGLLDHCKDIKCDSKRKCNDWQYHVQEIKYVSHI